jgi:hypothetical protein
MRSIIRSRTFTTSLEGKLRQDCGGEEEIICEANQVSLLELLAHPPRTNFHVIGIDEDYTVRVAKPLAVFRGIPTEW